MQEKQKPRTVKRDYLAKAIYDLLEEFGLVRGNPRTGVAHKIVRVIFSTIKEALQRGESVKIDGLGIFSIHTRPPRFKSLTYFEGGQGKAKARVNARLTLHLPSKQIVTFIPSKTILKELNNES